MNQSGVLVLKPTKLNSRRLYNLLRISTKYVERVLYVDFGLARAQRKVLSNTEIYKILQVVYETTTKETAALDVRVLLGSFKEKYVKQTLCYPPDVALLENSFKSIPDIAEAVHNRYNFGNVSENTLLFLESNEEKSGEEINIKDDTEMKTYRTCAVGGTFDRIHNGHRLLLSTCCLLSEEKVVVGVSAEPLLVNKTLAELIEPLETRMKNVEQFINDIKPGLVKEVVPLYDPAGPTKTDPDIECLIVSSETLEGGNAVNHMRKEAGLPEMDLFTIDLVDDHDSQAINNDSKMSSTLNRHRDLGTLLKPVVRRPNAENSNVYVVGLTGGIASGKSAIAKRLEKLGAEIIDADLLGHFAYKPGTDCYKKIIQTFGTEILSEDETINRKYLGAVVFSDSEKLKLLNSIVWPEIMTEIKKNISEMENVSGSHVCVIDAALLLEAEWNALVDEVWVSCVPPSEAVVRIKDRNGLTTEEAKRRLQNQISNKERVSQANVVLSTLWEPEKTQKQVEKAWNELQTRIKLFINSVL